MEEGDEDKPTTYEMPETMIGTLLSWFYLDFTKLFILQIKKLNFKEIR